jgi:hypothetical protein
MMVIHNQNSIGSSLFLLHPFLIPRDGGGIIVTGVEMLG